MNKKPLVYIAGPYSSDPVTNVRSAIRVAEVIEARQCAVIIPHLSMLWDLIRPAPIHVWYGRDIEVLLHCDALVRFEGDSTGADREVEIARENDIRTFNFDQHGMAAFSIWREAQGYVPR